MGRDVVRKSPRDMLGTEKPLYSQGLEEVIVRDFFQDRRGGFFADVGSAHPVEHSTTSYLERHLGWSGVGVDALPEYAPRYEELRPGTRFRNYIVSDHSGTIEGFYRVKSAEGLSSIDPDRAFGGRTLASERIEVATITLDELLDGEGVERIDFLSMDVEESTLVALSAFTLGRFRPELVCIEVGGPRRGHRGPVEEYFAHNGYERVPKYRDLKRANWWFRPIA